MTPLSFGEIARYCKDLSADNKAQRQAFSWLFHRFFIAFSIGIGFFIAVPLAQVFNDFGVVNGCQVKVYIWIEYIFSSTTGHRLIKL